MRTVLREKVTTIYELNKNVCTVNFKSNQQEHNNDSNHL